MEMCVQQSAQKAELHGSRRVGMEVCVCLAAVLLLLTSQHTTADQPNPRRTVHHLYEVGHLSSPPAFYVLHFLFLVERNGEIVGDLVCARCQTEEMMCRTRQEGGDEHGVGREIMPPSFFLVLLCFK